MNVMHKYLRYLWYLDTWILPLYLHEKSYLLLMYMMYMRTAWPWWNWPWHELDLELECELSMSAILESCQKTWIIWCVCYIPHDVHVPASIPPSDAGNISIFEDGTLIASSMRQWLQFWNKEWSWCLWPLSSMNYKRHTWEQTEAMMYNKSSGWWL